MIEVKSNKPILLIIEPETIIVSFIRDLVSFIMIIGAMHLTQDNVWWSAITTIILIMAIIGKGGRGLMRTIRTRNELLAYADELDEKLQCPNRD